MNIFTPLLSVTPAVTKNSSTVCQMLNLVPFCIFRPDIYNANTSSNIDTQK